MHRLCYILAVLFITGAFLLVGKRIVDGDESGKPAINSLSAYVRAIPKPCASANVAPHDFYKYDLLGSVVNYTCLDSMDGLSEHYRLAAKSGGWHINSRSTAEAGERFVYCKGRIALDVDIEPEGERVRVSVGTYWTSDRGSLRYCS